MDKKNLLDQIEKSVINCKKCRLCENALNAVPGEGSENSEIVFIGEAPGAVEDKTGQPFVGRAGKLLEGLLEKIGYKRDEVWIGNVIKHRPPNNRDPLPDEIKSCEPYLTMQLKIIDPKLVVTLGRFAMNYFHKEGKISDDHGRLIILDKFNVYPVYHPAAALRSTKLAKTLLKDFIKIPQILDDVSANSEKIAEERRIKLKKTNPLGLGL